ncbi:hypothetical protein ACIBCB_18240 [Streptomyces uncialis]|uniref:hypothetical protein n=1 Tax=Streptomyces uncialis TaxID=1048205 RepID=UPI0037B79D4D
MSEMTCRECDLGAYAIRPDGLIECTECRRISDLRDMYFDPDETWMVNESGLLQHYLMPGACLSALAGIPGWDTGDWAKSQEALRHYRLLIDELTASLHVGLALPAAPHRGLARV